ncbi:MAG: hypothetical protein Q9M31_08010 [Mariprofundus sp.]|nr:hypothetical protein [Mariprofundus sp.]
MSEYIHIFKYQVISGLLLMALFVILGQYIIAVSSLYGSLLMAAGSWMLSRKMLGSDDLSGEALQVSLYKGAAGRFLLMLAGLMLGFWLGLSLPAIAGGMFAAQLLFYVASLMRYRTEMRSKGEDLG